jgi:hypothetical protein
MESNKSFVEVMVDEQEKDELSPEVLAAIMAALLCMEESSYGSVNLRVREVWPQESAWRWVGW